MQPDQVVLQDMAELGEAARAPVSRSRGLEVIAEFFSIRRLVTN